MEDTSSDEDNDEGNVLGAAIDFHTTGVGATGANARCQSAVETVHKKVQVLAARRIHARAALRRSVTRMHNVLFAQRALFEEEQPKHRIDAACQVNATKDDAERQLEASYAAMYLALDTLVERLQSVRRAEHVVHPEECVRPAVLGLAVSGPSTSWRVEDIRPPDAPLPRLCDAVTKVFLAAFSNSDMALNRCKRKFGPREQQQQQQNSSTKKARGRQ